MGKRTPDRVAALAADIGSPGVIAKIDKAAAELRRELLDLADLRKMAVRRHGETASEPGAQNNEIEKPDHPNQAEVSQNSALSDPRSEPETIAELVDSYTTHEKSPYQALRFSSRVNYDRKLHQIKKDCGEVRLADLKTPQIQHFYEGWLGGGKIAKIASAHGYVTMLRGIINFGAKVLEDSKCELLSVILHNMHFENARVRTERLTVEHVRAFIAKAHEMEFPSMALAQAFQFECELSQKDVIGEWVPLDEQTPPGPQVEDVDSGKKWVRGLVWSEIDNKKWILRHPLSMTGRVTEFRLSRCPLILKEFTRLGTFPPDGPVIISDTTLRPYRANHFRKIWRKIARAAGIPDDVRNVDHGREGDDDSSEDDEVVMEMQRGSQRV